MSIGNLHMSCTSFQLLVGSCHVCVILGDAVAKVGTLEARKKHLCASCENAKDPLGRKVSEVSISVHLVFYTWSFR